MEESAEKQNKLASELDEIQGRDATLRNSRFKKAVFNFWEWVKPVYLGTRRNEFPIEPSMSLLVPRIFTDEKDLKKIETYTRRLKEAVKDRHVLNIAVTGPYGSGKSTILRTFENLCKTDLTFVFISLANFSGPSKKEDSDLRFNRRIEISILQHLFYHVSPKRIPDSRFKRIVSSKKKNAHIHIVCFVAWVLSAFLLFKFGFLNHLNPRSWRIDLPLDWVAIIVISIFLVGLGYYSNKIFEMFGNSRINKVNLNGEFELSDNNDKSIFNKYLEEILYFFENTQIDIVVFEDLDRFENLDIFTKLREVNSLINNSELMSRKVKFIYAVKDDMFDTNTNRVKFFDYIVPIIPFVNQANAKDQFTALLRNSKLDQTLSADLISDIVTFIEGIDMRLLNNIVQEFSVYQEQLSPELRREKLFAIVLYKNVFPEDFVSLHQRKGRLYDLFFVHKFDKIRALSNSYQDRITELNARIQILENEMLRSVYDLRSIYLYRIASEVEGFVGFRRNGAITFKEALEDENFDFIRQSSSIVITRQHDSMYHKEFNLNKNFKYFEDLIDDRRTYEERLSVLTLRKSENEAKLRSEIDEIRENLPNFNGLALRDLFEPEDFNAFEKGILKSDLVRNLILSGYIEEDYEDYLAPFSEVNISLTDYQYERAVKIRESLGHNFEIKHVESLIKRISPTYFLHPCALNHQVFLFILKNRFRFPEHWEASLNCLIQAGERDILFYSDAANWSIQDISYVTRELVSAKKDLWTLLSMNFANDKSKLIASTIQLIEHSNAADLKQQKNFDKMIQFLSYYEGLFHQRDEIDLLQKFEAVFINSSLRIKNLTGFFGEKTISVEKLTASRNFDLNIQNIIFILKKTLDSYSEEEFNRAPFSYIQNSNSSLLISMIDYQLEDFVNNVLLKFETIEEDEKHFLSIINDLFLTPSQVSMLLKIQKSNLSFLKDVERVETMQLILSAGKVDVTWQSVFQYVDREGTDEWDDVIISYLNQENVFLKLGKTTIDAHSIGEERFGIFCEILFRRDNLSLEAFKNYISVVPVDFIPESMEYIREEKISILIESGMLHFSLETLASIQIISEDLVFKYLEANSESAAHHFPEFEISDEIWVKLLKSERIDDSIKSTIIEYIKHDKVSLGANLLDAINEIVDVVEAKLINYDFLIVICKSHLPKDSVLRWILKGIDNINFDQCNSLFDYIGGKYSEVFESRKRPTFKYDEIKYKLFQLLKAKDWIKNVLLDERKTEIKVIAHDYD